MRPHLILLLTLPLLGASCIDTSSAPSLPPEMAPKDLYRVEWGPNGPEDNPRALAVGGFTFAAYEVGLDSYGREFRRLAHLRNLENQWTETLGSASVGPLSPLSKGMEVWAKDITFDQRYGGRIFRLFYPTKLLVSPEGIPTLVWPREEEVTVEVKPSWPWGGTEPLTSDNAPITLATLLAQKVKQIELVSRRLGHAWPSTTLDLYRHVEGWELEKTALPLAELLSPPKGLTGASPGQAGGA